MELTCPAEEEKSEVLTPVNWVWFQVLNVSARSWTPILSLMWKSLCKDRFQLSRPGPFTLFFGEFPQVSGAG